MAALTLDKIIERAKAIGLPIAKDEFRKTKETPLPDLPYLIYIIPQETGRGADCKNFVVAKQVGLELYTDKIADAKLEREIEKKVLFDIAYEKSQDTIESEDMVQTAYDFTVVEKIRKR